MHRYALPFALLLVSGCGYNTIQRYDETVNAAKNQIEVQLQRRADLIPNLVATVKGYAQQEQDVFVQVAQARAGVLGAVQKGDPREMANANDQLTGALFEQGTARLGTCAAQPRRCPQTRLLAGHLAAERPEIIPYLALSPGLRS